MWPGSLTVAANCTPAPARHPRAASGEGRTYSDRVPNASKESCPDKFSKQKTKGGPLAGQISKTK